MKAVVFDLDGTLINSTEQIVRTVNQSLSFLRLPELPIDEYVKQYGRGNNPFLESVVEELQLKDEVLIDSLSKDFLSRYEKLESSSEDVFEGIYPLLEELKIKGYYVGIFTNKPHHLAIKVVEDIFPNKIDCVLGRKNNFPKKPSPKGIHVMCEKWNIDEKDCIYVGDTEMDMTTGNSAGCYTIGVLWGNRNESMLKKAGAKALVEKPKEILSYL